MEVILPKNKSWTQVPLKGALVGKDFKDCLGGIETITKYKLKKVNKKRKKPISSQSEVPKKKAKTSKNEPSPKKASNSTKQEATNSSKRASKLKKKTKKKRKSVKSDDAQAEKGQNADDTKPTKTKGRNKKLRDKEMKKKSKKLENLQINRENTEEKVEQNVDEETMKMATTEWESLFVPESLRKALYDLGFATATPIQRSVLPAAIKGRVDILGAAETGSGKTLAFGLPMISGILEDMEREKCADIEQDDDEGKELFDDDEFEDMSDDEIQVGCVKVVNDVKFDFEVQDEEIFTPPIEIFEEIDTISKQKQKLRGLVLTPTRELAIQIQKHLESVAKYTNLRISVVVGGMAPQKQSRVLKYRPEIVVATPGRLWDLIQEGDHHLSTVGDIKYLAIDETDRMCEKGHFDELHQLLELINHDEEKRSKRQNFVFSATLGFVPDAPKHGGKNTHKKKFKKRTPEEKLQAIMTLIGMKEKRKIVDLTQKFGTAETLTESLIRASITEKDFYLYYFLQMHPGKTLVFCNSIDCVRRLVNLFSYLKCSPNGLHAQMIQKQRLKSLERFAKADNALLIATDVAARGLDISGIEHVVHYQIPKTTESYVHRSGRTARSRKEGISIMLIDPSENFLYRKMCKNLNREEDLPVFPIDKKAFTTSKLRVQVARELDKMKLSLKKESVSDNWWKKAAEEADIILSEDEEDILDENETKEEAQKNLKLKIKEKEAELNTMLSKSVEGQRFIGKYPTSSGKLDLQLSDEVGSKKSALEALGIDVKETAKLLKRKGSKGRRKSKRK